MPKVANNLAKCLVDVTGLPLRLDGPLGRVGSHRTVSLVSERLECEIVLRSGQIGARVAQIVAIWAAPT